MTKRYCLAYGHEKIFFPVDKINLQGVLEINEAVPLPDPAGAINRALANPIGTPPLRQLVSGRKKAAILINDDTRVANTSFFLPFLLGEIETGGIVGDDISIIFANGTHRPLPGEMQKELAGNYIFNHYRLFNHDCRSQENLVYVGQTSRGNRVEINRIISEADAVVLTGSIVYHFFAGYGGGRKAAVPGVAGLNTICFNHRLMLEKGAELGRLVGNPVHEDLMEAVEFIKPVFLFNVVLNPGREFLGIFAGDYIQAHEAGCRLVDKVYGVTIQKKADLVVASCGGYPKDLNLYQAHKTLENAIRAVSDGGVIILLAQCPEGLGSDTLREWLDKYDSPSAIRKAISQKFVIGGHKAFALTRLAEIAKIILVSDLPPELVSKLRYIPAKTLDQALVMACDFLEQKNPETYLMPQCSLTLPLLADFPRIEPRLR